ncbi:MAG: ABC transporter transmembrane domain-containing protein, partial [Gammaproteobacteria bacterium]
MAKEKKDFRILFRLWRYVLPYRWQFALGVAAMVAEAAAHSGIPVMLKPFIDDAFFAKDPDMMLWAPAALVGLFILRGLMSFANSISVMWISGNIVLKLREEMFTRIVDLPTPFFDDAHSGALINKITHNATQISATTTKVITVLVKDSMTVIFLVGYVVWLNWKLSLLLLIMIPIMTLVVRKFAKRMRRLSHQFQDSMGDLLQVCQETVGGHSVVKIFGGQNYERKRFHHVANWTRRYHFKLRAAGAANVPIVQILVGLITATVMYLGLYMIEEKVLTEGEFISYLVAIGLLSAPIKQLTAINQPLQKGIAAAENIFGLMDEPPEPDTGTKTQHMDKVEVRFNQVFFRYQNSEADVLSDISFTIPAGKTVALIGASGSGKSTIASLLPRFYEADSGRITLNDTDITELTLPALREHIALVTQHVTLFNDTIRANIAYGFKKPPPDEEIEKAARAAHAWEFIDALPEGLSTLVGENG